MKGTIACDFDGPLHKYSQGWQGGNIYDEPAENAFQALRRLQKDWAVYVLTARRDLMTVAEWLTTKGGFPTAVNGTIHGQVVSNVPNVVAIPTTWSWNNQQRILVSNLKLPAYHYIDDRGIRFVNWEQTLSFVNGGTSVRDQ